MDQMSFERQIFSRNSHLLPSPLMPTTLRLRNTSLDLESKSGAARLQEEVVCIEF